MEPTIKVGLGSRLGSKGSVEVLLHLLREMMAESGDPFKWEDDARALLARCTEGPR